MNKKREQKLFTFTFQAEFRMPTTFMHKAKQIPFNFGIQVLYINFMILLVSLSFMFFIIFFYFNF